MRIIDFHTHAFPDDLASKAIPLLEEEAGVKAVLDGTLQALASSMERSGICLSVVSSIATKPAQFESILNWSMKIACSTIMPFASVHPDDPDVLEKISRIGEVGLKGIKLHPYYQEFVIDERKMYPIYERILELGLVFLCHAGFDIAFERRRIADPVRIRRVIDDLSGLKFVASHLGAWNDWNQVEVHLLGQAVYLDVSYSKGFITSDQARRILNGHPSDKIIFGTDSPWAGHEETIAFIKSMGLDADFEAGIFFDNAAALLEYEGETDVL